MASRISFKRILADEENPVTVVIKKPGPVTRNQLNEETPGEPVTVATLTGVSIQPVRSETIQREAGRQVQSTHELFCEPCECKDGYTVEVTDAKGATTVYTVNGDPKDYGTHLEVTLACPAR
ncbi:MAG: hypothetical protein QME79_12540 [Bacillota bacterium]|nr:hypothetical protein [Bacillota bacterium]